MLSPVRPHLHDQNLRRSAFTIVEMLIAMAVTLLMMVALGRMFQSVGRGMQDSRASVEMSAKLRTVTFTLKNELSRCTASMTPPLNSGDAAGYLVYYDGPMSDASVLKFTAASSGIDDIPDYRATSKYGDFDDYLAFTAVAEDESYFSGVVPEYLVLGGSSTAPMTITSKYAEIVYWVQPILESGGTVVDRDGDGLPDYLNLHKRVLLIRPDLNNSSGLLPSFSLPASGSWPTNYRDMASVFQNADLSMRRPLKANGMPGDVADGIAANSLSDLTLPHNRFAHVRHPGGTSAGALQFGNSLELTSMPVLDLNGPISGDYLSTKTLARTLESNGGFLRSDYSLVGDRIGEDVLLTGIMGFDVKAFDPDAPMIIAVGPDGLPGNSGTVGDFGVLGSDDVILTPDDPGFGVALRGKSPATHPTYSSTDQWQFTLGSRGGFVDLDYVYKAGGATQAAASTTSLFETNLLTYCDTAFSGLDRSRLVAGYRFPLGLYKSGRHLERRGFRFYQPAYDTFASDYEFDGYNQADSDSGVGTVWYAAGYPTTTALIDEGNDNLDNGGLAGVDDAQERETGPPISAALRALQVQIRIEDASTRQVRQMVVTQEFVE